jgi:predicted lipid-binding transport protein (Tim44 family)
VSPAAAAAAAAAATAAGEACGSDASSTASSATNCRSAAATQGDVHKAREALAKVEGMYSDAAKVQVDNHVTIVHESA